MKILSRIIILVTGFLFLGFDFLLYRSFEEQKAVVVSIKNKEDVEAEFNTNKFKEQADQIERLNKALDSARSQIKQQNESISSQKDTLLQEAEKRQSIEEQNKSVQTSLIDIKAEADAIKQDMKNWQKDYVSVLAELEKKMDDSKSQMQSLQDNMVDLKTAIENQNHPASPAPESVNAVSDNAAVDNSQL